MRDCAKIKSTALVILLTFFSWPCAAQEDEVTLNFRETELLAVLEYYSQLTGKVFVPAEGVRGLVTVISPGPMNKKQAVDLLFSILDMRGLAVSEVNDFYKVIPKPDAIYSATTPLSSLSSGDQLVTEMIKPQYIQVSTVFQSLQAMISPQGKLISDANLNFFVLTDTADNIKQFKRMFTLLDKPVAVPVSRTYKLQYAKVEILTPLITTLLQGAAASNMGAAMAAPPTVLNDVRSNTMIVSAPDKMQAQVARIIEELDTRSPQVLLEATIVEVTLNDSNKLGVQWQFFLDRANPQAALSLSGSDQPSLLSNAAENLPALQGLTFGLLRQDDYAALVNLLASDTSARILSSPHLVASNNQEASLRIGDEVPILKELRLDVDNNPIRTFDRQKVGLEFKVTPSIALNRDVSMKLFINISSVLGGSNTENNQFTTAEREVQTDVVVKDRQALVISGLMRNNANDTSSGIPNVRKTPMLGKLFGSESSEGEKGELLILIRPRVITTEDEALAASDAQLRKLPTAANAGAIDEPVFEFDL